MFLTAMAVCMLTAAVSSAQEKDGVRFRGGVSATAGTMAVSNYSGFLAGVDGRLGLQINNLIGVYVDPHLSFGPVKVGNIGSTAIGVFSATGIVDVTLFDRMFVGAGGGFGIVNNPTGAALHFRLGGYPLMGRGEDGIRRKGLVLAADVQTYFLSGVTVLQPMGSIGYEAF
jgi:hypothetical protein